ncbi:hypothetical protein GCM10010299_72490 [Streptomyces tanashiensis]|nr:hypothetical protein GCM10010299_72490 [Streptomyces tanashiensis]
MGTTDGALAGARGSRALTRTPGGGAIVVRVQALEAEAPAEAPSRPRRGPARAGRGPTRGPAPAVGYTASARRREWMRSGAPGRA